MAKKKNKDLLPTQTKRKFVYGDADEMTKRILTERDLTSSPAIIQFLQELPPDQIDTLTREAVPKGFENFAVAAMVFNLGQYLPALTIMTGDGRLAAEMVEDTRKTVEEYHESYGATMSFAVYLSTYNREESDFTRILRKATMKQPLPEKLTKQPETFNYPTGRELSLLSEMINNVGDLDDYPERKAQVSHGQNFIYGETVIKKIKNDDSDEVEEIVEGTFISNSEKFGSLSFIIDDIRKFTRGKKVAQKMLLKALKAVQAAPKVKGEPLFDTIAIPIEELTGGEHGYKSGIAARKAFMDGFELLSMIKGDFRNMSGSITDAIIQLFHEPYIKDSIGYVSITKARGVWPALLREFACVPSYFDDLSTMSQLLLLYAITSARRNRSQFVRDGKKNYIDISYRAIQTNLGLPSETKIRNKRRDIIYPIHEAMKEISDREKRRVRRKKDPTPCIDFETVGISSIYKKAGKTIPVEEYLQNGKVRVYLAGDILEPLLEINEKQQKAITAARRRRAKRKRDEEKAKQTEAADKEKATESSSGKEDG